jgi:hypothetical protein
MHSPTAEERREDAQQLPASRAYIENLLASPLLRANFDDRCLIGPG